MKTYLTALLLGTVFGLTSLQAQSPYTPNASTLFLYHFDEDAGSTQAADASGANRHATRMSAATAGGGAQTGMGLSHAPATGLNARTYWVDPAAPGTSGSVLHELITGEFTIEMWFRSDAGSLSTTRNLVVIQPATATNPSQTPNPWGADFSINLVGNSGNPYLTLSDGGQINFFHTNGRQSIQPIVAEQWYHLALTARPISETQTVYTFYLNTPGTDPTPTAFHTMTGRTLMHHAGGSTPPQVPYAGLNRRLEIGSNYSNNGLNYFAGQIDELRISNVALTTFDTLQPIPEPSHAILLMGGAILLMGGSFLRRTSLAHR